MGTVDHFSEAIIALNSCLGMLRRRLPNRHVNLGGTAGVGDPCVAGRAGERRHRLWVESPEVR
jgi:hypothetical protein